MRALQLKKKSIPWWRFWGAGWGLWGGRNEKLPGLSNGREVIVREGKDSRWRVLLEEKGRGEENL